VEEFMETIKKKSKSSLIRGLMALESFSPERESFTLAEFSRFLDIPKSSLHRILKELSEMNYIRYEEQSKRYYLGTGVLSLGFSVLGSMEVREIARPYMEKLSKECNKTVNLAVFDKNEMVYVERIRVYGLRTFNIGVGSRFPSWDTAIGKCVLAHLGHSLFEKTMKNLKRFPDFKADQHELEKSLEEIRKNGFAFSDRVAKGGFLTIAVPIFSSEGVAYAMNMIAEPEDATIETMRERYAPKLINVGNELSKALGYRV
jgi:DNA-binding IclR family transcriptional regulator